LDNVILLAFKSPAGVPEISRNCNDRLDATAAGPANPMISLPFRRPSQDATIDALYGTIVAQARSPCFYRDYGVPDTVAGRFDMVVLHLVLLLRSLQGTASPIGQRLFDRFCRDMDHNFREMGVGDLAVPKEMRRVAEAFYGRSRAYQTALDRGDAAALEAAVARNVFGAAAAPLGARRLATYMIEAARELSVVDSARLLRAEVKYPEPEAVSIPVEAGPEP
jgi:cytochrome b pre-mRNA-processing protein 3